MLHSKAIWLAVALAAMPLGLSAAVKDVQGIDIIVKRQPTGSTARVTIGDGGTVRFDLAGPGAYVIQAFRAAGAEALDTPITLAGNFARKSPGNGNPVTGKTMDGNTLFAAGTDRGDNSALFSLAIDVAAPVAFVGQLNLEDDIGIDARHLTFYSVVNGPQAPAQSITISNDSTSAAGYTAVFESVGAVRWTANLSKSSGSVAASSSDSIEVRPQTGLPSGAYHGFARIRLQTADGIREKVAAVTLFVQAPAQAKGTLVLDGPMTALYPTPSGGYEKSSFRVTNNSATSQTYTPTPDAGLTITPARLTLSPGESGSFDAEVAAIQAPPGSWVKKCVVVLSSTGVFGVKCYWAWVGSSSALAAPCTPNQLQPVITKLNPQVARAGHPLDVTVQVYDNCGGQYEDFTALMRVTDGAESHISTVQSSGRKAITKSGSANFAKIVPGNSRDALSDTAPELDLRGYVYPYFTVGAAGLTLRIDAEAPNPAGGEPLTGSVSMSLDYDFDASAPLVAQNAFVSNATYERAPLTPLSVFALFTVIPGLPGEDAKSVPFPEVLGGVQVLIDGKGKVPLIRARSGLVPGIVPYDIADGTHIVNLLYGGRMSGAITFEVARAGGAPLLADSQSHAHLYDPQGRPNSRTNPMRANQVWIFYGGDFGRIKGVELTAGATVPTAALPAEQECKLRIGENPAAVLYCGLSPASVVLYQTNFSVPVIAAPNARAGDVVELPIVLDQAGYRGSTAVLGWFQVSAAQSSINISVQANYPDAKFSVNNQTITGNTGLLTFNAGTPIPLNVPADPQAPSAGTRYYFNGWSQGGNRSQTIAPGASTAFGVYFLASYLLTIDGTATVQPPSYFNGGNPSSDGYYTQTPSVFIPVKVTGSCAGGATPLGLIVKYGLTGKQVANGSTIVMDKPARVSVVCPPPTTPIGSCVAPPPGLIGWYPLDEVTGTVARNIGSLTGADGTYKASPTAAAGKVAGAYDFRNGGSVEVNNPAAYNLLAGKAMSFDAWILGAPALGTGTHHILGKHHPVGSPGYFLTIKNGLLALHLHDTANDIIDFTEPIPGPLPLHAPVNDGNWHHVAATVDLNSRVGVLYVDGVSVLTFTAAHFGSAFYSMTNSNNLIISWANFPGRIDEVEIFDRALTSTEVQNIYRADRFGKCKPGANYAVTISGCAATVGPQSLAVGTNTFPANSNLTVTANPGTGTLVNISITMGGSTKVYTSSPVNFVLTGPAVIVVQCTTGGPTSCIAPPAGMVGWYPLDETSGPTAANLLGPATTNATYQNTPLPDSNGKVAGALNFQGNRWVEVNSATAYNFGTGNFSIDAWIKTGAGFSSGVETIVEKRSGSGSAGYILFLYQGRLALQMADTTNSNYVAPVGTPVLSDGAWHHVAATVNRSGNGGTLYVDGVSIMTFNSGARPGSLDNTGKLAIGWNRGEGAGFHGWIDEVELFNTVVPAADIQRIYAAGSFGKCKTPPTTTFPATISGCNATLGPVALQSTPGNWQANANLTVSATVPAGGLGNVKITMGGITTTYTSFPANFTLTGAATIVVECNAKPGVCIAPPAGMVGWYPLDEASGTLVNDLAANPAPLSVQGSPSVSPGPNPQGKVAGGWNFWSGNDSVASAGSPAKYNFGSGSFSVDGWLQFLGGQQVVPLVRKITSGSSITGFAVQVANGALSLDLGSGGSTATRWIGTKNIMSDNQWHHFVVVVSRTASPGVRFYVDGQVDALTVNPAMISGSIDNTVPLQLSGVELRLDEVELFNRELNVTEAQNLFLADALGKCKALVCPGSPSDALGQFSLESAAGPVADNKGVLNGAIVTPSSTSGTHTNGGIVTLTPGKVNMGLTFLNSPRAAINIANHPDLNAHNHDITVTTQVKLAPGEGGYVFGRFWNTPHQLGRFGGGAHGRDGFFVDRVTHALGLEVFDGNQGTSGNMSWISTNPNLQVPSDNAWHCIGYRLRQTASGFEVSVFRDGHAELITNYPTKGYPTFPLTALPGVPRIYIGWQGVGGIYDTGFFGSLDELQILGRSLADSEMAAICNCSTSTAFPITVNTSPAGIGATAALLPGGSATNVYTLASATAGSYVAGVSPTTITGSTTEYRLKPAQSWSLNGVPQAWAGPFTPTRNVIAATTFTANFDTYFKVTLTLGGCTSNNSAGIPASGGTAWVLAGSSFTTSILAGAGGFQIAPTYNGTAMLVQAGTNGPFSALTIPVVGGPITIVAGCAAANDVSVTVRTLPAVGLSFTLGGTPALTGGNPYVAPKSYTAAPGATGYSHSTTPVQTVGGTYYEFQNWSPSATPASFGQQIPSIPSTNTTYTATFAPKGYVVTVINNCSSAAVTGSGVSPISTNPLIFPANSSLTVTATAGAGRSFTNIVVSPGGAGPFTTNPANIGVLTRPITVTVNCGTLTTVTHNVTTNPTGQGLKVTIDGVQVTPPTTVNWTPNSAHTLGVSPLQQVNLAGTTLYGFNTWNQTPTIAAAPSLPNTYAASFTAVGYKLTTSVQTILEPNRTPGCSVTANPPVPANGFYPPGTVVTLTATLSPGWTFNSYGGDTTSTGGVITSPPITMSGPKNIIAYCNPPGGLQLGLVTRGVDGGGGGFRVNLKLTNGNVGAANNVVVTSLTAPGLALVTVLPISVGNIASNQSQSFFVSFSYSGPSPGAFNVQATWTFVNAATGATETGQGVLTVP